MLHPDLDHLFPGTPGTRPGTGPTLTPRPGVLDGSVRLHIARQLQDYLAERSVLGYRAYVVGMSGGVDSAVCAQLLVDAVPGAVHAVAVDMGDADDELATSLRLTEQLAVPCTVLDGRATYEAHRSVMPERRVISRIHVRSRLITSMLFQWADNQDGLVVDTTDRSEEILRLYEEGRRGNVAPVIGLYKSELHAIADAMGLGALSRSGCPDLDNHDAFGMPWDQLDHVLDGLARHARVEELAAMHGVDDAWVTALARRVRMQPLRTDVVHLHPEPNP